jgi:hypothetical protein
MIGKTSEKKSNRNTNTVEGHSSRLKQAEDRISKLEGEIEFKGN